jgi:hypothetical protein
MTTHYGAHILLALLCLLALATSASAGCAWVMWTAIYVPNQRDLASYTRETGYPSAQDCIKALDAQSTSSQENISLRPKASVSKVDRTESTELFLWHREGGADVFRCYPDTVDPRGPKGK